MAQMALEIYLAGCTKRCPGCHNPESWEFDQGVSFSDELPRLKEKATHLLVEKVWILGGEPLDQPLGSLRFLIRSLRQANPRAEFWLFTGKDLACVPEEIKALFEVIKWGSYKKDLPPKRITEESLTLASDNQGLLRRKENG